MHSSTSNSKSFDCAAKRAPDMPWVKVFTLVFLLSIVMLAAVEMGWRALDISPSLVNNEPLWQDQLNQLRDAQQTENSVLLIGSSRIQNGVKPTLLSQELGVDVFNLSISGTSSYDLLDFVANDTVFNGVVIVELWPQHHMIQELSDGRKAKQYINYEEQASFIDPFEFELDRILHENFRLFHPHLNTIELFFHALYSREVKYPVESYNVMRYGPLDYKRQSAERMAKLTKKYIKLAESAEPIVDEDALMARRQVFLKPIEKIQKRGGRVVFVHTTLSGEMREIEARKFPREKYWNPFVKGLADASLHYQDNEALNSIVCADGVHMGAELVEIQTKAIAQFTKEYLK